MNGLAQRDAVFPVFVQFVGCDGGGDRFCVVHETVMLRASHWTRYSYTRSGELSEADLRAYLARVGVTDVDGLVEEARTIGRRG